MDDPRRLLGARVRELRKARSLTQEVLADQVDLHVTYVGGIERGERNPSLVNIARIASALNVSLAELFAPLDRLPDQRALRMLRARRRRRKQP